MSTIGEAARDSGVAVETIRYYERAGIVPKPPRSRTGRRVYGAPEIARLRLIRRCRDLGFPLADARALLGMAESGPAPCGEFRAVAESHLAEVRRKRDDLAALERALGELVRSCNGGPAAECPALRALLAD
jgi:MerR family mercuric resistance operon transcriptional regulator